MHLNSKAGLHGAHHLRALLLGCRDGGLSNDLAIWRTLWSGGEDQARHAHAFIPNQLAANHRP